MNNLERSGEGLRTLPPLQNNTTDIIQRYTVIPFKETHSDAACVARIIEIHLLNKLRIDGKELFSLTGLTVPDCEATAEEINTLLSHCAVLCRREEEELAFRLREVNETEHLFQQASTGASSIADARNGSKSRADRADREHRYQSALTRKMEQQTRLNHIKSLPGLLAEEANYIEEGINKKLLNGFSRMARIPTGFLDAFRQAEIKNAADFIINALNELTEAVKKIIQLCTFPLDKYTANNGGVARALAYRDYYCANSYLLRAIISDRDYVEYVHDHKSISERKNKIFPH
ncbi:hypothetical protein M2371_000175 [Buttiauxella sp. BIGb0471]|uniref:hypothetical protein n=1 Tax=Buttiauxella sp. BIGb0471 TaxID=2940597 RepID=UPI00216A7B38|nr:hypothetical protein [Buttiauxella sp. BIGb0471]MCS3600989.1 hypothetical protein [Buttiauxella sp. BIGb0471]